jgi:hypothetical protein
MAAACGVSDFLGAVVLPKAYNNSDC